MRLIDADALELSFKQTGKCERCKNQCLQRKSISKWGMHCKVIAAAPTIDAVKADGNTSDGYHTFNELYDHRAKLFSVIVRNYPDLCWKSKQHHDGTMYDGMFIVGIDTPDGQASYHYDIDPYWNMFDCKELERAPVWDGHTPQQAIDRIAALQKRADAVPVVHGYWLYGDEYAGHHDVDCSVCKESAHTYYDYCPNCGAKMDGGADG